LRGFERNRGFLAALRANGLRLDPLHASRTRSVVLRAICFTSLAPLGLVLEALIGEEHLLAGGEDEFSPTFRTLQDPIIVFHTLLRGPGSRRTGSHAATWGQRSDELPHEVAVLIWPPAQSCAENSSDVFSYSSSRRCFLRRRLRERACFVRRFSPGFM
jgi:hypothetical protein